MNTYCYSFHSIRILKSELFLIFTNFAGMLLGIYLARFCGSSRYILLSACATKPSAFLLLLVSVLPVVLLLLILRSRLLALSYPLIFLWSLSYGFSGMLVFHAIGEGAWLIRPLLLFSSNGISVILWWLSIRHFNALKRSFTKDMILVGFLLLVLLLLDTLCISNYLSHISTYF